MREIYIRETEYKTIESVRPPPPEIVYIQPQEPDRLGFLGFVGVVMLIVGIVIFASAFSRVFAQSNVRQFYGQGDYGSNRTTVIIVPVPVQPRPMPYFDSTARQDCKTIENGMETCYFNGMLDWRCKPGTVGTSRMECDVWDGRRVDSRNPKPWQH